MSLLTQAILCETIIYSEIKEKVINLVEIFKPIRYSNQRAYKR